MAATLDEIIANFEMLDDQDDRWRYLIELGRELEPLPDAARNDDNKVRGCASQVWVETRLDDGGHLRFRGDSDAHIVKGLVRLMLAIHDGRTPDEALAEDALALFTRLGLAQHLSPQRSNGVRSMLERIRADARAALVR
jgi:cysteine desulfuration protein SufE